MSLTAAQIRDRAAQELGLLQLNQSLRAEHATRITQGYAEVYAQLKKDGLATWAYAGDIPDEVCTYVAALIADNCLNTYGVSESRFQRIKLAAAEARREMQKHTAPDYVSQEQAVDY